MLSAENHIQGVNLINLNQIGDHRGSVLHMLRSDAQDFTQFGECYFSEIFHGAVKAWKKHREQTQNIAVPVGRILLVIYDDRELSTTRGKLLEIELGRPDAYQGFKCISSEAALLVNCADYPHNKNESEVISFDDPTIPYDWILGNKVS
jgi:dTDP-4-dehydrorhamnose 3,5-epimerase